MQIKYTIKEIRPQIFLVSFREHYDMSWTLFRYSEFYESGNKKIQGNPKAKFFETLKDYARRKGKGDFKYVTDWVGFNLPSWVFDKLDPCSLPDGEENPYDIVMSDILFKISEKLHKRKNKDFYLIAVPLNFEKKVEKYYGGKKKAKKEVKGVIKHELSHGLFYTNPEYKKTMTELVENLPKKLRKKVDKILRDEYGYAENVLVDEIAAFMSTGLTDEMLEVVTKGKITKPFRKAFKKFAGKIR